MSDSKFRVIIAGAGGIGRAVGLLLRELGDFKVDIALGDKYEKVAKEACAWIQGDSKAEGKVSYFVMPDTDDASGFKEYFSGADIVLDCLPGNLAPRIAKLAKNYRLHYANLTEYVKETSEVIKIAENAERGFILQSGLAPGFINVLANGLFQQFCREFQGRESRFNFYEGRCLNSKRFFSLFLWFYLESGWGGNLVC